MAFAVDLSHDAPAAFLGVERSIGGRRWRTRPASELTVREIASRMSLAEPLARALASRGITAQTAENYLRPTLKALFPDPSSFMGMDEAARVLIDAFERDRKTIVFADYDVDGASSAAQLVRWWRAMGRELPIYVPDRLTEGYGPSPAAFRHLREAGYELVITVDCGAAAYDALNAAAEVGLEVVVIDHHLMREVPPAARALVNPNQIGCGSDQGVLAAAGVTFVLLAALNREARRLGWFAERPEPDLRQWLDLAALGAICDVTQLVGFNRVLAAQGLKVMSNWANPGLKALLDVAGAKGPASVFHAGFVLGPRINAGGRIGRADLGARLLSTDDAAEALSLAQELDALNAERKAVETQILEAAIANIEAGANFDPAAPAIVVAEEGWHPGVIGIVASRLRERYRRPVVVVGLDRASDIGKGSGRSQPGVNLGRAIQAAFDEGLLLAGGGHAMAAGVTLRPSAVPEFRAFLCERLAGEMVEAEADDALEIDALVTPGAAARPLFDAFQSMAPFGPGNPEPVFAIADVRVERVTPMRGGHLRCTLVGAGGASIRAIAWRSADTPIGQRLLAGGGSLHAVGKLKTDDWNGRNTVELEIEDLADPRMN
jgi:single-stranded-DNA-specific exonuclease